MSERSWRPQHRWARASNMSGLWDLLNRARREPKRIPRALVGRIAPNSKFGPSWIRRPDGFFTFRDDGFVAASSPPMLLARHNWEIRYIRRLLRGVAAEQSLEIGCGYGRLSPIIAEYSRHHIGIDINLDALATARLSYPGLQFEEASATSLPFPDDSFGLVTTWTVLQHIPPDRFNEVVAEVKRVLLANGTLLICEETRKLDADDQHTWHRPLETYAESFEPLTLLFESYIDEIDRLPGMETPGRVMLFRHQSPKRVARGSA
jgi:SAM-dependent methyltransferase